MQKANDLEKNVVPGNDFNKLWFTFLFLSLKNQRVKIKTRIISFCWFPLDLKRQVDERSLEIKLLKDMVNSAKTMVRVRD